MLAPLPLPLPLPCPLPSWQTKPIHADDPNKSFARPATTFRQIKMNMKAAAAPNAYSPSLSPFTPLSLSLLARSICPIDRPRPAAPPWCTSLAIDIKICHSFFDVLYFLFDLSPRSPSPKGWKQNILSFLFFSCIKRKSAQPVEHLMGILAGCLSFVACLFCISLDILSSAT